MANEVLLQNTATARHQTCRKADMSWTRYTSLSCGEVVPNFLKSTAAHDALYDAITLMRTDVNAYKTLFGSQDVPDSCSTDQLNFENLVCERRGAKRQACNDENTSLNMVNLLKTRKDFIDNIDSRRACKL